MILIGCSKCSSSQNVKIYVKNLDGIGPGVCNIKVFYEIGLRRFFALPGQEEVSEIVCGQLGLEPIDRFLAGPEHNASCEKQAQKLLANKVESLTV